MTEMRVDAHLHLWDPSLGVYTWLTPEHGPLHATFGPEQARAELGRAQVHSAVLVQAADSPVDTEHLLGIAAAHPWVAGVVGWVDLEDPDGVDDELDRLTALAGGSKLSGIRQLVHDDPRDDVLALAPVARTAGRLAARGLPLDVPDAFPRQLAGAIALAGAHDDLVVVLDHLGKPPRGTGRGEELDEWERQLRDLARRDNVVAKVSGLHVPGTELTTDALRPVLDVALDAFGPRRLMIGSDWPVSLLGADYAGTMATLGGLVAELSGAEQDDLWWRTAARTYRLAPERWRADPEGTRPPPTAQP